MYVTKKFLKRYKDKNEGFDDPYSWPLSVMFFVLDVMITCEFETRIK